MTIARRLIAAAVAAVLAPAQSPPPKPLPTEPPKIEISDEERSERVKMLANRLPEVPADAIPPIDKAPERFRGVRWRMQYLFDQDESRMALNDMKFASPERGFAAVHRLEKGREHREVLLTRDGGQTWQPVKVSGVPFSLFPLDDSRVWLVTSSGFYYSAEGGVQWEKRKRPSAGSLRVYFKDDNRGWAYGVGKTIWQTGDGGRSWKKLPESEKINLRDERTSFCCMDFANPEAGMLAGNSAAPRTDVSRLPDWMIPDRAVKRRLTPSSTVVLETRDGGETWRPQVTSAFGLIRKVRMTPELGITIFGYNDSFLFASEVVEIELATGKSRPLFRRKDVDAMDAILLKDGGALVAAIEPRGVLRAAPIPGKLRIFWSPDRKEWYETKVDYRAVGHRAYLSYVDGGHIWAATDEGAILRLSR
jgi:photosystem II stability/assembly factor-like uncharacterized protein